MRLVNIARPNAHCPYGCEVREAHCGPIRHIQMSLTTESTLDRRPELGPPAPVPRIFATLVPCGHRVEVVPGEDGRGVRFTESVDAERRRSASEGRGRVPGPQEPGDVRFMPLPESHHVYR